MHALPLPVLPEVAAVPLFIPGGHQDGVGGCPGAELGRAESGITVSGVGAGPHAHPELEMTRVGGLSLPLVLFSRLLPRDLQPGPQVRGVATCLYLRGDCVVTAEGICWLRCRSHPLGSYPGGPPRWRKVRRGTQDTHTGHDHMGTPLRRLNRPVLSWPQFLAQGRACKTCKGLNSK